MRLGLIHKCVWKMERAMRSKWNYLSFIFNDLCEWGAEFYGPKSGNFLAQSAATEGLSKAHRLSAAVF